MCQSHEEGKMTKPGLCSSEIRRSHQSHSDATCRWSSSQHLTAPKISWGENQLLIFFGGNKLSSSFFQSKFSGNITLSLLVKE